MPALPLATQEDAIVAEVIARLRQGIRISALACPVLTAIVWVAELVTPEPIPLTAHLSRLASIVIALMLAAAVERAPPRWVLAEGLFLCGAFMIYPTYTLWVTGGATSSDFPIIPGVFFFAPFMLMFTPRWLALVQTVYLVAICFALHAGTPEATPAAVAGKAYKFMVLIYVFSLIIGVRNYRTLRANVLLRLRVQDDARRAALAQERVRMARHLHDHVGAGLTGIALRAEREQRRSADRPDAWSWTQSAAALCLDELRDAIWALSEQHRDTEELMSILRRRAEDACGSADIALRWEVVGAPRTVEVRAELATTLSSVLRESVANAIRHSGTRAIAIRSEFMMDSLRVTVADEGCGLRSDNEEGRGLNNIRARAREVGGEANIDNGAAGGVVVTVSLPTRRLTV